MVNVGMMNFQ